MSQTSWRLLLPFSMIVCPLAVKVPPATAQSLWSNVQTGPLAGDWFQAANWNPAAVPDDSKVAQINNGGEARADTATAPANVAAMQLDVGKNGGTGFFTNDGVDVTIEGSFDIGDTELGFATGSSIVSSMGTVIIRDASSMRIGDVGVGDLDIGQTFATDTAQATGHGALTAERVALITVADDLDVGETGGAAQATGTGNLTLNDSGTINVGGNFEIGETGSATGVMISDGTAVLDGGTQLQVGGNLNVSRTFGSGGQDSGSGALTLLDFGTVDIGSGFDVGHTGVTGGGTAQSNGTLDVDRLTTLNVAAQLGIGHIRNTSGSGSASATGLATLSDVDNIVVSGDVFVGRNFTNDDVQGTATGTLIIERSDHIQIGVDLDVAQAGAGVLTSGTGMATGTGSATIRDVVGTIDVGNDIDVGQTSAVAGTGAEGDGMLLIERAGSLDVATDFDIGQVGGQGQARGTGDVTMVDVDFVDVGADMDVGQTRGSPNGLNQGDGSITMKRGALSIGFSEPLDPGSLDIASVTVLSNERAEAIGSVVLEDVNLQVASRINLGELVGGGSDGANSSDATLHLNRSLASTEVLDVATQDPDTAGTATARLNMDTSLILVNGTVSLGPGATLEMDIGGSTKADGSGGAGQFSAIDAASATLGGSLVLTLSGGFTPTVGQMFPILSTTGGIDGSFASAHRLTAGDTTLSVLYDPLSVYVVAIFLGDMDRDNDVDFDDIDDFVLALSDANSYVSAFGVPPTLHGDIDDDGDQDFDDINGFVSLLTGASNSSLRAVPEPSSCMLCGALALAMLVAARPFRFPPGAR